MGIRFSIIWRIQNPIDPKDRTIDRPEQRFASRVGSAVPSGTGAAVFFFSILLLEGLVMLMSKHRARPDRLPRPRRAQLQLESLEDRCLLSNDGLSQLAGWLPADAVAPSSTVKVKATYVAPADSLDGVVIS